MLETDFWNKHAKPGLFPYGDFQRVENTADTGTPDVNFAVKGFGQGWIELKVAHDGWLKFELFQLPWIRRRLKAAPGTCWVLAYIDEGTCGTLIIPGAVALRAERRAYGKHVFIAVDAILRETGWQYLTTWSELATILGRN